MFVKRIPLAYIEQINILNFYSRPLYLVVGDLFPGTKIFRIQLKAKLAIFLFLFVYTIFNVNLYFFCICVLYLFFYCIMNFDGGICTL